MHRIVLASESPYRKAQLSSLGVSFDTKKPLIDEEFEKQKFHTPKAMAQGLANLKALSLRQEGFVVIGGDQLVSLNGKILGKPKTFEKAVTQLMDLQNKTHEIITAIAVVTSDQIFEHTDVTKLTMKAFSKNEIEDYVKLDQPLDCAGSYKFEKNGAQLFSCVESEDLSSIVGLPLIKLQHILQNLGYDFKKI
jgi:septum formation protein